MRLWPLEQGLIGEEWSRPESLVQLLLLPLVTIGTNKYSHQSTVHFKSDPQHSTHSILSLSLCLQEENNHKCVKVAWSLTTVWQDLTSDLVFIFCIKTVTEIFRRGKIRCLVRDGLIRTPFVAKWLELPCFVFLKHNKPGWKNWCGNPRYKFNAYCCTLNNCPFKSVQLIDNILMLCILLQDTKLDQYFAKWPGFCFFYT